MSYKKNRDYKSLKILYTYLSEGIMKRTEVERLLGEPTYSPIEGQYYYSSDHMDYIEENGSKWKASVGIIIEYRDYHNNNGILTDKVQGIWLGPIGE